jgi:hypothetical protein
MSSGLHQYWFALRDLESGSINHFLVMFIGDVAGSILLIALIKYGIDLMRRTVPEVLKQTVQLVLRQGQVLA